MAQLARRRFSEAEKSHAFKRRLTQFRFNIGRLCSSPYGSPEPQRRSSLTRLRGEGDNESDVSDLELSNSLSDDDRSVVSDTSDRAPDNAPRISENASRSEEPPRALGSEHEGSASEYQSPSESLDNSSLNLCQWCEGINVESLCSDQGYEHKLLSELPSHEQLCYLGDWDNKSSTGICKLCLVFMDAFAKEDLAHLDQDRHMLILGLKGGEIHDQDHFDDYGWSDDQKVKIKGRSISNLVLGLADLDVLEKLEEPHSDDDAVCDVQLRLWRHTRRLHCFTDVDDPSVPFGVVPVRQIGESTLSEASFEVAASWISQCLAADPPQATNVHLERVDISEYEEFGHWIDDGFRLESGDSSASDVAGPDRPRRLLEIGVGPDRDSVRLIEDNEDEVPYATLSYCWGKSPQNKPFEWLTTTANLRSRMDGLRRSELPQTLQDSITVAEGLGIQHIWIDSLCIIQDSGDDWAVEAAKMGDIYKGSLVTVVAASSSTSRSGFFNQRSISTMQSLRSEGKLISIQTPFSDGLACNLHIITEWPLEYVLGRYTAVPLGLGQEIEDLYKIQVQKGPWINRAWTLQVQILSRRLLFYTDKMLLWECDHCRLSEDLHPQMQGDSLYPLEMMGSSAPEGYTNFEVALTVDFWYCGLVEDYTKRQLTFSRDKLIAISALARATSQRMHIKYFAGLWGNSIRYGLMWHRGGPGSKNTASTCPSWSWASQSSSISYRRLIKADSSAGPGDPRVLDVHVEPSDIRNPFGDVKSGYIILQTKVQMGRVLPDFLGRKPKSWSSDFKLFNGRSLLIDSGTVMRYWPMFAYMDDEDVKHDRVLIAVVGQENWTPIALLLHPPYLGAKAYRRVGLAHMDFDDEVVNSKFMEPLHREIAMWAPQSIKIV